MAEPVSNSGSPRILIPAPADERHAHLAWPKVAKTSDGTIILAYSAGQFHGDHGGGCPAVSVSTDEGATFTPPSILSEFGQGEPYTACGNLAIGVTKENVVVIMAMAYRGTAANTILGWASVDRGKKWREINVSSLAGGRTGSVYGNIFPVEGRGYAVCGHYRPGSYPHETGLWISFSQDALHWGPPEQIHTDHLVEPAVTCVDDRIIGLIRQPDKQNIYGLLEANRRRLDWTLTDSQIRSPLPTKRLPSPFITTDPDNPSRLIALMTQRTIPGNTPGTITLWTSEDQGRTFMPGQEIISFPHATGNVDTDFGYPWMIKRENGKWLMVFYFGQQKGPNAIWGLDLEI
jgi:hypothetical protein